ncbi:hypothetical protein GOB86_09295 [Acetobacter lambici]|uniref:Uncharacterized protein n=1 Tax=Acetobacter lambici TaxID=1332824 RepID=A0ABT1F461_9PROT|nr:hypothetical protein [Acetobacter lambici]MCP1242889.1 hypothetical protein [Acetobacter lambici]MCP1259059.1 hypothetical protein [Acetobacter lambici]NHO57252.1 hypothetical protein [Acetobacter lambici]
MAQEAQPTESLYDILYADRARLSSYLAQIDPNGVITGYKTSTTDGSSVGSELGGGVPTVASAKARYSIENKDLAERTFDPAAALPIEVMNRLDENGYIHRDLKNVPIGGLLLVKGRFALRDFSQFPAFWPLMKKILPFKDLATNANNQFSKKTISVNDIESLFKSLLEDIPQPVQLTFETSKEYLWSTLAEEGFATSPIDIFLKHKGIIPGEWYILAIVDGHPISTENADDASIPDSFGESLGIPFHQLAQDMRSLFGRPDNNYGVSPLVIFRQVHCSKVNG